MKSNLNSSPGQPKTSSLQPLVLACVAFVAGIALTGIWFHHHHPAAKSDKLSNSTKTMLGRLAAPVTIHYYALLPAGSADATLQAFGGRVAELLAAMQTASGGKVQLTSVNTPADATATAATADGVQPFNLDKGDACYLGLAVASGKNTESFARLSPEWEPALEFDLARAIERVATAAAPAQPAPAVAKPSPEIVATINRLIPDVSAVSVEQADQIFHAEFLKRFGEVAAEGETQFQAAQQKVVDAQASGSPAEVETARNNLTEVQLAQGEKLKAVAAQLQTQLAVFERMKSGLTNDAK
jgi:hypothetical protein